MESIEVDFPFDGFSIDAIQRAAYRFTDRFSCEFVPIDGVHRCRLHLRADVADVVVDEFRNEVLDQVLRERIRRETEGVRNAILAVAFSNTGLVD